MTNTITLPPKPNLGLPNPRRWRAQRSPRFGIWAKGLGQSCQYVQARSLGPGEQPDEKRATAKVPLKCQGQRLLSTKAFASREWLTQSLFSKSLNKSTPSFQSFNHLSSLKFLSLILSSLLCLQEKFHPLKNGNSTTKLMYFVPLAKRYSRPWKISTPNQKQNPHKEQTFSLIPNTHKFLCCSQTYFHFI